MKEITVQEMAVLHDKYGMTWSLNDGQITGFQLVNENNLTADQCE